MSARDTAVLRFAQYGQEPAQQKRQNGRLRVRHPGGRGGPDGGGARHPDPAVPAVVPTGVRPAGGTSPQPHLPGGVRFRRARTPRQDRTRGHQPESLCRGHGVHAHVRNIPGPSQPAAKERRNHSGPSKVRTERRRSSDAPFDVFNPPAPPALLRRRRMEWLQSPRAVLLAATRTPHQNYINVKKKKTLHAAKFTCHGPSKFEAGTESGTTYFLNTWDEIWEYGVAYYHIVDAIKAIVFWRSHATFVPELQYLPAEK
mmetsp:Transcript_5363/g.11045  ORF Transcript_5363/g.11045 Transcript_5363/m.11045 type:complete len:257 (+) Transcript_5363:1164-1934(+)